MILFSSRGLPFDHGRVGSRIMLPTITGSPAICVCTDASTCRGGIEWSKREINVTSSHPPILASRAQVYLPVRFCCVSILDGGHPAFSEDCARSTAGSARPPIRKQLTKTYDLADGAVSRAREPRRFGGNSFHSADHDPATAAPVAGTRSRPAITVSGDTLRNALVAGLDASQQSNIVGAGGATPAIAASSHIPGSAVTQFANDLCSSAQAIPLAVWPMVPVCG
jgi:hypothetical protein